MLVSLRPRSPTDYSRSHRLHRRESLVMASPTSAKVPSPLSPSSAQLHPDAATASERRPSNARQRSWHHPYAPSVRAPLPASDRSPEGHIQALQQQQQQEYSPQARRSSVTHESYQERTGRSPYARPTYPPSPRLVLDGVGPQRNRTRANTLSVPRHEHMPTSSASFANSARAPSPTYAANYADQFQPPRSWDDHRSRRDSFVSRVGENFMPSRHSPPQHPATSPLLFAPLSANRETFAYNARRPSIPMSIPRPDRAAVVRSRPVTPISPLNMDSLSMDDPAMNSVTLHSSPPDARHRDYALDRHRAAHYEPSRSPHAPSQLEQRYESREYAHHASPLSGVGATLYTPRDQPRLQPTYTSNHPRLAPGQMVPPSPAHHTVPLDHGYPRHMAYTPVEQSFPAEYVHPSRMRSSSIAEGQQAAPVDRIAHSRRRRRPPYSYASMITQAISSSIEGRMTLREIYTWISSNFNGYPMSGPDSQGWQNTVRHNLSLGKIFVKKQRTAQDIYDSCSSGNPAQSQAARGKGGWWTLHPVVLEQIRSGQRTHNDEFDDVERLVELDSATKAGQASALPLEKTLSRQRSYSDSMDASTASSLRRTLPTANQSATAPVTRRGSVRTNADTSVESTPNVPSTPSVLQPKASDVPPVLQGRMRGYTTSAAEAPSRSLQRDDDDDDDSDLENRGKDQGMDEDRYDHLPRYGVTVPYSQPDVEMEPSKSPAKHPEHVLREAREELVSTHIQQIKLQQKKQQQLSSPADESEDNTRRMDIRGLLNN